MHECHNASQKRSVALLDNAPIRVEIFGHLFYIQMCLGKMQCVHDLL